MKLYLAAPFAARDYVRDYAAPTLRQQGHTTTSGWLQSSRPLEPENLGTSPATEPEVVMHRAGLDLEEVLAADVLVHFTANYLCSRTRLDPTAHNLHSGGRHVETGYALAHHKSVIYLGEPENIFMRGLCHKARHLWDVIGILDDMREANPEPWVGDPV